MQERVAAGPDETSEPAGARAAPGGSPLARQVLALQRSAGNAAVTRMIARQELQWDPSLQPPDVTPPPMRPIQFVFILGAKDDEALATATAHYRSPLMSSPFRKVLTREDLPDATLSGILAYLGQIPYEIAEITLVIHGNADGELFVPLNSEDRDDRTTPDELSKALDAKVLDPLSGGQITEKTRIRLQACFSGHGAKGARMVNLLDKAFGSGEGTVIAPTVEVAYAKDVWHSEGLSGWWVASPRSLSVDEIAAAMQAKYGASLGDLDLGSYQDDEDGHHVGQPIKTNDEMWREIARTAQEERPNGQFLYLSSAWTQRVKPGYEDDPTLYTRSVIYNPKEI